MQNRSEKSNHWANSRSGKCQHKFGASKSGTTIETGPVGDAQPRTAAGRFLFYISRAVQFITRALAVGRFGAPIDREPSLFLIADLKNVIALNTSL
ncbi:MAG: hypothetical protein GWN41_05720 [Phycisphaerae bacterium]|nr:hypothetical protein [Phycisphaerae bacterium]